MIYIAIRNWVDRTLRGPAVQSRVVVMPAMIPVLLGLPFGNGRLVITVVSLSSVLWFGFVGWRYWLYLREISVDADQNYDRVGKYRLAKEYHGTESATAASVRKVQNG